MNRSIKLFKFLAVGFLLLNFGGPSAEVRAEEDVIFRDDFMGKALRPEWEVRAKDPNRMALIDNEYLLLVTYGPDSSAKNRMVYKGDLPESYEITLKIEATPELRYQGVSLGITQDGKNYLVNYYFINNITVARAYFGKNLMGEWSEYKNNTDLPRGKLLFLKLEKKGIEYTGYYSPDGASWSKIGTHVFINLKGRPYFIVYNTKKKVPETGIRIDYFEIRKIN
jgi:hypothetical protein